MTIRINCSLCNGCGNSKEPLCVRVCPGDLLYKNSQNKCEIRDARDCWDCAACVKECPRQAIEMYLPVHLGGRGATLKAKTDGGKINWILTKPDGSKEIFEIVTRNIKKER